MFSRNRFITSALALALLSRAADRAARTAKPALTADAAIRIPAAVSAAATNARWRRAKSLR